MTDIKQYFIDQEERVSNTYMSASGIVAPIPTEEKEKKPLFSIYNDECGWCMVPFNRFGGGRGGCRPNLLCLIVGGVLVYYLLKKK